MTGGRRVRGLQTFSVGPDVKVHSANCGQKRYDRKKRNFYLDCGEIRLGARYYVARRIAAHFPPEAQRRA